jgi:hypothetical protein
MTNVPAQLASALVLADGAFEMLVDAASELKNAGENEAHQELTTLASAVSDVVRRIGARKDELRDESGMPSAGSDIGSDP